MSPIVTRAQSSLSPIPCTQQQSTPSTQREETKENLSSQCPSNILPTDFEIDE